MSSKPTKSEAAPTAAEPSAQQQPAAPAPAAAEAKEKKAHAGPPDVFAAAKSINAKLSVFTIDEQLQILQFVRGVIETKQKAAYAEEIERERKQTLARFGSRGLSDSDRIGEVVSGAPLHAHANGAQAGVQ